MIDLRKVWHLRELRRKAEHYLNMAFLTEDYDRFYLNLYFKTCDIIREFVNESA